MRIAFLFFGFEDIILPMKREVIKGTIQGNERGYAFLIPERAENFAAPVKDYFIPHSDLRGAMHGDKVMCETTEETGGFRGERTTARVLKVLERGIKEIVGTYFTCRSGGFVTPDERKYFAEVFIPFGKGVRAKAGDKVVCRILSYPKKGNPEGIVSKILGRQFDKKAELASILYQYKLREKFPLSVIEEAEKYQDKITAEEIKARRDLRKTVTFTIDGEDARDFDDAVSASRTENGYVLGVHIADVSHYVKEDSDLDNEAFERGTSVYFPEKVIPMLPERLCNDLCSLREGVERLTLSCIMNIDKSGKVIDYVITPSVIKSKARLTYTEVQAYFDGDKAAAKKLKKVVPDLDVMKELAEILKRRREEKGSIDLEVKDSAILVKNGEIEVFPAKKDFAHSLIEEFMILANCTVAEYAYYLTLPFVYRVHGEPTEERTEKFYAFLAGLGINARRNREGIYPTDFQKILKSAEDTSAYPLINRVMLRTMQKAVYSPEPLGHFGLSEKHYCHFTSPIRRYPDLAVHRILKDVIGRGTEGIEEKYADFAEYASVQSSEREKIADAAERAVDDYYKLLYISEREGEEFDGVVSGVINAGLFVELECGVEGLVRAETLGGRKIICDKDNYTLTAGKKTYRLGEPVRIMVAGVNLVDRRAEFLIASEGYTGKGEKGGRKKHNA